MTNDSFCKLLKFIHQHDPFLLKCENLLCCFKVNKGMWKLWDNNEDFWFLMTTSRVEFVLYEQELEFLLPARVSDDQNSK